MKNKRISKDEYYLGNAKEIAKRAVCFRRFSGAIIVRDDQIVSTGYTGPPRKTLDCFERDFCLRNRLNIPSGQRYELCRSVHAEQNAIINAARAGVSLFGGDMYISGLDTQTQEPLDSFPCFICKKMIINAGLKRVVCTTKDSGIQIFNVEDWVRNWQNEKTDIVDDKHQYGEPIELTPPSNPREKNLDTPYGLLGSYGIMEPKFPEDDDDGDDEVPL